ncbi:MAG: hypothetical protein LLG06_10195, partial [Desulfobacteraceae bacterium]|nr:hypothetical protein [Desulfobacteraceae bacterium]
AWHEWFRLASLGALGLDKTVISTRMVVDPAHRHRIIFPLFYSYIMERYLEAGFEYAVHYCAPGLVCRYEELGHRLYAGPFAVPPGILRVPMLMALYDLDHLWKLNPPLAMLSSTAPLRPKTVPSGVISGICSPPNFRLMAPEERLAYVLDRAEPGCLPEPAALAPPLQFASPLHLKPGVFAPSPRGAGFLGLLLSGTILEGDSGLPAQPGGFIGAGHWLQPASPMTGFRVATEATILVFAQRLAEKVSRAHIVFPGASVWEVLRSASVLAARSRITSTGAKEK